jgi:hypothetical protein
MISKFKNLNNAIITSENKKIHISKYIINIKYFIQKNKKSDLFILKYFKYHFTKRVYFSI